MNALPYERQDELLRRWFSIPELRYLLRHRCHFCKKEKPWRHVSGNWKHFPPGTTGCGANLMLIALYDYATSKGEALKEQP